MREKNFQKKVPTKKNRSEKSGRRNEKNRQFGLPLGHLWDLFFAARKREDFDPQNVDQLSPSSLFGRDVAPVTGLQVCHHTSQVLERG